MNTTLIILILTHFLAFILGIAFTLFIRYRIKAKKNKTNASNHNVPKMSHGHDTPTKKEQVNSRPESNRAKDKSNPIKSDAQERKISKKELHRQQRKEENARKMREEAERKAALAELKRRRSFNPRTAKPENAVFTNLAISDGRLVPCSVGQTYYYHYWEYEGKYYFEFFCEQSKAAKAINNRSVILEPFCQKDSKSVPVDDARALEIIEFGELDNELNIISKSVIKYI